MTKASDSTNRKVSSQYVKKVYKSNSKSFKSIKQPCSTSIGYRLRSKSLADTTKTSCDSSLLNSRLARPKSTSLILSTEELELKKIEEERENLKRKRYKSKRKYESLKKGFNSEIPVYRSIKELTVPITPIRRLTKRLGKKTYSIAAEANTSLVNIEPHLPFSNIQAGPTLPEPFTFQTEKRAKIRPTESIRKQSILLSGEIIQQFIKDPRSHEVPLNAAKELTEPKSPNLLTSKRAAFDYKQIKNRDELEKELMEEFQKNPFKAKPIDKRIFESTGELGVPKVSVRPLTEAQPFNLRIDQRSVRRKTMSSVDCSKAKETPNPTTRKITNSSKVIEKMKLTIPKSPKLSKSRSNFCCETKVLKDMKTIDAAANCSKDNSYKLTVTQPKEFRLSTSVRGEIHKSRLDEKIKAMMEKENQPHEFISKPAPKFGQPFQPTPSKREPTTIQEFNLRSVSRHETSKNNLCKKIEAENIKELEMKSFRARSVLKPFNSNCSFSSVNDTSLILED